MPESPKKIAPKWHHPKDIMKLHNLKLKKRALQARISSNQVSQEPSTSNNVFDKVLTAKKRKNPFLNEKDNKKSKPEQPPPLDESTDQTLFKLLHASQSNGESYTSFENIFTKISGEDALKQENVCVVKAHGKEWLPIDWTLKTKARLLSLVPFAWNLKLKISEEASGIIGFTRCLDTDTKTQLDISPNAKFHQCCLYWQQPSFPWMDLFPRNIAKSNVRSFANNSEIKQCLYSAWTDSFRSLFQLLRTRQCPYFYVCANTFTVIFRAAGICGFTDVHAIMTPTTRGLRQMLRQEEIEFSMPLKKKRESDQGYESLDSIGQYKEDDVNVNFSKLQNDLEEEYCEDDWLKTMGINQQDIRQINYTQERMVQKAECEVDNSEQSLVLVVGVEINGFYNFLMNCKSTIAVTGPFAGIPPTLLAPVAFRGATLNALNVRSTKVHVDNNEYHSIELSGPILPDTIHNLFLINPTDHSMTMTFKDIQNTQVFSKVFCRKEESSQNCVAAFGQENLSDCGLKQKILKCFCESNNPENVCNIECIKYSSDTKTFTWA